MLTTFTALADKNRLRIVELLRRGPQPVGDIGLRLGLRQPQASKHLSVLRRAGLVQMRPNAQQRLYELKAEPLRELDAWLEPYRRYWNARLDALERRLTELDPPKPKRKRSPR